RGGRIPRSPAVGVVYNVPMADPAPNAATVDGCAAQAQYPKLAPVIGYLDSLRGRADLGRLSELLGQIRITREDIAGCCQFRSEGVGGFPVLRRSVWFTMFLWPIQHRTPRL